MIIWRGLGLWVLFIVGGVVLASQIAFATLFPDFTLLYGDLPVGASILLAAAACYPFGEYTRKRQGIVQDGEAALDFGHHSLYFVPVHVWTWVLAVGGAALLIYQLMT